MNASLATDDAEGEALLPLSALNDLLYCERRCWLHRVAGLDEDNASTFLGQFEHERADEPSVERRPGVRIERALPLFSRALGLIGRADVVEFHAEPDAGEVAYPIDYKHGPRRQWDNDDVQLCAQAMCLEEMLARPITGGAIFHVKSKRRREVEFTPELREQVRQAARRLREVVESPYSPPFGLRPQCDGCAMHPHCLPEAAAAAGAVREYCRTLFDTGRQP